MSKSKKAPDNRSLTVSLRLTPEQLEFIDRQAKHELRTRPDWMRMRLLAGSGLWP